jgi:oligopeptide transport system ATP-binding protein
MTENEILLEVRGLRMWFPITQGIVFQRHIGDIKAVDGLDFFIRRGETLGLVGESGCGKSTTGRSILQLYRPTAGDVFFEGQNLCKLKGEPLRRVRRKMQMIFQDPYASLNPRMTVGDIVGEPLDVHNILKGKALRERVMELLEVVGLNRYFVNRYPHEFSGGQRQRIGVARALAVQPDFIVCDEPISALDVSIQAQIINLLEELQEQFHLTYLFIAHDLSVVKHIANRVAVMYLGKIVELTTRERLYADPLHPYTQALLSAVPIPDPVVEERRQRIILTGDVPSPANPPKGCHFNTRCGVMIAGTCDVTEPEFKDVGGEHWVACHRVG